MFREHQSLPHLLPHHLSLRRKLCSPLQRPNAAGRSQKTKSNFLTALYVAIVLSPQRVSSSVLILAEASCQPCRRACCDPHIYCSNATHRQVTSPSSVPNAPHVRPRSFPFLYLLRSPRQTPNSADRHVSYLECCSNCLRLGNGDYGKRSCNGMY